MRPKWSDLKSRTSTSQHGFFFFRHHLGWAAFSAAASSFVAHCLAPRNLAVDRVAFTAENSKSRLLSLQQGAAAILTALIPVPAAAGLQGAFGATPGLFPDRKRCNASFEIAVLALCHLAALVHCHARAISDQEAKGQDQKHGLASTDYFSNKAAEFEPMLA